MKPIITAFEKSPDGGQGLARDMRVRWAMEEVGLAYDVRLVSFKSMKQQAHTSRQPFGQIPTYEEGGIVIFESGAIVLHIAQHHPGLLPADEPGEARAMAWLFAALNSIEPAIVERERVYFTERDESWYQARLPFIDEQIRSRLDPLSARLGDADWLDGTFSVGDLMMVMVLRRLEPEMLAEYPNLAAYVARAERRPAYQRAFAAQKAVADAAHAG